MGIGSPFGTHRVIEPIGVMPQAAWKLNNNMDHIYDNEILVKVERLNIDAASFTQLEEEAGGDPQKIAGQIKRIIKERGKMHNPVTGSGGMFIGTVKTIGPALKAKIDLKEGDRIASLVSLSLTPLLLKRIKKIDMDKDQVEVDGLAILFESGVYAKLPSDLPDKLCLAVLDVAGAPAQTARLVKPGDTVLIIGAGGKSGLLCLYEARKRAGVTGKVIGLGHSKESTKRIEESGFADIAFQGDATKPVEVYEKMMELTQGKLADVTINCVNIPGTEMASIMSTRDGGIVYFFSMATSFTAAALGAEGIGKDVTMIIGNGYAQGHDKISLHLLRESPKLREMFERMFI
ncbi:MAG: L-erythro-3,5-diaminohexanoate dehydrogenase [Coprothermobacterota bacterium]|jgi:L-erythro-3,5-diaminohexanoate dehydrogenase|nr:L-erythro-3,5-diaminohexanoate dehydrogenase [Caldisericota bacterium]MDI6868493.1 L-erythro-3,5-diaminohexanoate dehydrogenase [Coprothermobacterota bacterium]